MAEQLRRDRALDPLARRMIRDLVVPDVYVDAHWPDDQGPLFDVVAIDRAGQGDPHVVLLAPNVADVEPQLRVLIETPAAYKWLAFDSRSMDLAAYGQLIAHPAFYPGRGAGRVGAIEVFRMAGDELGTRLVTRAERFGPTYELATAFAARHAPSYRLD